MEPTVLCAPIDFLGIVDVKSYIYIRGISRASELPCYNSNDLKIALNNSIKIDILSNQIKHIQIISRYQKIIW